MITLYHAPQSRSSRMIWLLEELHAPYAIFPVSIFRPMTGAGAPDPANPHPDKQVPAIAHNGVVVTESLAIVLYLADAFPEAGLAPAIGHPHRGPYLACAAWYAAALEPAMFAHFAGELDSRPDKRRNYDAVVRRLEEALAAGPYMLGERFSAVDILVGSAINWARQAFPESAALDAYAARCRARPAALKAAGLDDSQGVQRAA
ncbi:MAG: glutathione S-transferase [Caulobacteraceae bacterium]|nr:glutathione S-transferase [Caulobacteraceae bacterium]